MTKDLNLIIKKEISPVLKQVESMSIESSEDMPKATEILSRINKYADYLKTDRLKLTAPLEASLKLIREKYTPTEKLLKSAVDMLKEKISSYQSNAVRIQNEEQAKIAIGLATGKIKNIDQAMKKMAKIDSPEEKVQTDSGAVSFRTVKKFEVKDLALLPLEYHLADEAKIRKAMVEGIELDGVKYWEEQSVVNKRN